MICRSPIAMCCGSQTTASFGTTGSTSNSHRLRDSRATQLPADLPRKRDSGARRHGRQPHARHGAATRSGSHTEAAADGANSLLHPVQTAPGTRCIAVGTLDPDAIISHLEFQSLELKKSSQVQLHVFV